MPFLPVDHQATGAIAANAQTVILDVTRHAIATVTLTGTWVGTVQFEVTTDNVTWVGIPVTPVAGGATVTSATANGTWSVYVSAYAAVRLRASAWTSGSVAVAIRASAAGGSLTALTAGRIVFADASGVLAQDSNLFWDATNHRLGIGTQSPQYPIDAAISSANGPNYGLHVAYTATNPSVFGASPIRLDTLILNTDQASGFNATSQGIVSSTFVGQQGASPIAASNGATTFAAGVNVENVDLVLGANAEYAPYFGYVTWDTNLTSATTQNRASNVHKILLSAADATGGSWNVTIGGQTATIPFNGNSGTVQTNVAALSSVGAGNAQAAGSAGTYFLYLIGTLVGSNTAVTVSASGLTGPSAPYTATVYGGFGGPGAGRGRSWVTDFKLCGPVLQQPDSLQGINMAVRNHYPGYPSAIANSGAIWAISDVNAGHSGGIDELNAPLWAVSTGVGVVGKGTTVAGVDQRGFDVAFRAGGAGSAWGVTASHLGTGLLAQDYDAIGVDIGASYAAATVPALRVQQNTTPVILGAAAQAQGAFLEVTGKAYFSTQVGIGAAPSAAALVNFGNFNVGAGNGNAIGLNLFSTMTPGSGSAFFAQIGGNISTNNANVSNGYGVFIPAIGKVGANTITGNVFGLNITQPTASAVATNNYIAGFLGASGEEVDIQFAEELLTLSTVGATTDTTANLLPANAEILVVTARVTTTITTATNWSVGDATTPARFVSAQSTLTAGTTAVGLNHKNGAAAGAAAAQLAAAKVRVTTTGTPGAGIVRIAVAYILHKAPTS